MAERPLNPVAPSDPPRPPLPLLGFRQHLRMARARLVGCDPAHGQDVTWAAGWDRCSPTGCRLVRLPGQDVGEPRGPSSWPTTGSTDPDARR